MGCLEATQAVRAVLPASVIRYRFADSITTPGLVVIAEDTERAEEADAARALAEPTSSELVPAEAGHGWDLVVEEGRLSPIGEQIVAYATK